MTKKLRNRKGCATGEIRTGQAPPRPYIIQIERPNQRLDLQRVQELLQGTGVELDESYGPILVNADLGRHVVRGRATQQARERAEKIPGVRFFGDAKISPFGPSQP